MKTFARFGILAVAGAFAALAVSSGSATPPGKNGLLLFQKQVGSVTQLFTMAPDGTGLRQLTHGIHIAEDAAWSPDGKLIAFSCQCSTAASILLIRAYGSGLRTLTPNGLQTYPAFAPNGRWIVYTRTLAKDNSLWVMDINGKHQRRLTLTHNVFRPQGNFLPADEFPAVSPDGKRVAFIHALSERRSALFVIGFDGHGQRRLTPWSMSAGGKIDWAPDGSRILFHTNLQSQVYTIHPDASGLTQLTSRTDDYCSGSFSPDGMQILLLANCSSDTDTNLYTMSTDGGTPTLVPNSHGAHRASWGPTAS